MRKRTIGKYFRFNEDEEYLLRKLSRKSGLSESEVIRSSLRSIILIEKPTREFYEAIEKINKIGININQLTKVANRTGNIFEQDLKKYFEEIMSINERILKKYL